MDDQTPDGTTGDPRSVELTRIGPGRFKATNVRGGETFMGTGGEDPDFTPVELLLAAIAGCSAMDVEAITHKRTTSTTYDVHADGTKVRDEHGNHLTGVRVSFDIAFPDGPDGDAARARVRGAIEMSRDRLCTVSRTVQLGADVVYLDAGEELSRP
ncbi:OsmC family protein [Nocardioides KLBMP 9356]|uniref:OsmC family protein n=1 Tax=Nocardioides potassii TaxID=2911371 RepID=A0ABS9HCA5_9ACTN|nr:OsmC family protein [Nocardioides potassii]MCF6377751.1 OsmC family protein [Nocardioides potassii]